MHDVRWLAGGSWALGRLVVGWSLWWVDYITGLVGEAGRTDHLTYAHAAKRLRSEISTVMLGCCRDIE